MRRSIALSLLVASAPLALPGAVEAAPTRRVVNRIVAIVDYEVITQRDVDRRAAGGEPRSAIIEGLVAAELLVAEADRRRLTVEPSEIEVALAEIARQNNLTVAQVFMEAAKVGFDEAAYRADLRRQILQLRVINSYIADEVTRGGTPPTGGMEGARDKLVAELRTRAYVEVRP